MDYHAVWSMDCRISETVVSRAAADTIGTTTSMTSTGAACNSRIAKEGRDTSQNVSLHPLCSPLQELTQAKDHREKKN
jgi:hypothetical protein